jgi:serine/threonine-protein kinase
VPLLALLVGAGLAAAVLSALTDGTPPTAVAAQTQEEDAGILLEAADHLGRPIEDVATQLSALGLSVERREQVTDRTVPGRVLGVSPTGVVLEPGDDVVVTYAVAPPDPAPRTGGGDGGGGVSPVTGVGVPDRAPGPPAAPTGTAGGASAPPPAAPATTPAPTTPAPTTPGTPSPTSPPTSSSATPTPTGEPGPTSSSPTATTSSSPTTTTSSEPVPPSGGPPSSSASDSPGAGGGSPQV